MEYDRAVIIRTDCPELTAETMMNAFAYLNLYDVVIGPAEDGGYYLSGVNQLYSKLLKMLAGALKLFLKIHSAFVGKIISVILFYQYGMVWMNKRI